MGKLTYDVGSIAGAETSYIDSKGEWHYKHSYQVWNCMLVRCYNEYYVKHNKSAQGCYVSDDWLMYKNFDTWYNANYIEGFKLDKQVKSKQHGDKVYSAETCKFISCSCNIDES